MSQPICEATNSHSGIEQDTFTETLGMESDTPARTGSQWENTVEILHLREYEITPDPLPDRKVARLPVKSREAIDILHAMARQNPKQAIQELPQWIERHPDIPVFKNLLAAAYTMNDEDLLAEEVIHETYRKHPDYLFARVTMAQRYIDKAEFDKVAEIFDGKFDLSLLYPNRRKFHISEFLCFMSVIGQYFLGVGNKEVAKVVLQSMQSIDPQDPKTLSLSKKLWTISFSNVLRHFGADPKKKRKRGQD